MRRLAAIAAACLLVMTGAVAPVSATESSDITTDITVGAGHTYPSGLWGFTDGCETGIASGQEMRCAFEFNLPGALNSSKILSATLKIARTGGCAANDCPVHIDSYAGNGSADLADVSQTASELATWTPTSSAVHQWNVLGLVQSDITNSEYWAGFVLRWVSGDSATQDFAISGASRVTLSITYIYQPVDINVFLGMTEVGAAGKVTSTPAGINCGTTCTMTIEYASPMKLTAVPLNAQTFFVGWQGIPCDEGQNSLTCSFIVPSIPPNIQATFTAAAVTQPPPTATPGPTSPHATAAPKPSAKASAGASQVPKTAAPATVAPTSGSSAAPAPTGAGETVTFAPGETLGPTLAPTTPTADSGGGLPLGPIILIVGVVLAIAIGGGAYMYARRKQEMSPPGS
jgi:hypothetical protein